MALTGTVIFAGNSIGSLDYHVPAGSLAYREAHEVFAAESKGENTFIGNWFSVDEDVCCTPCVWPPNKDFDVLVAGHDEIDASAYLVDTAGDSATEDRWLQCLCLYACGRVDKPRSLCHFSYTNPTCRQVMDRVTELFGTRNQCRRDQDRGRWS